MKYFFLIMLLLLFLFSCSIDNNKNGELTIFSPSGLVNRYSSVVTSNGSPISTPEEGNFRINYFVEMDNNILYTKTSKPGEKITLSIPSNNFINLYVGVYYAEDSSTTDELYNSYLTSYKIENLYVLPGETKKIDIELDLNKKTPFVSNAEYLMSDINGIVTYQGANYVVFVNRPYNRYYEGDLVGYGNNNASSDFKNKFKNIENSYFDNCGRATGVFLTDGNKILMTTSNNNNKSSTLHHPDINEFVSFTGFTQIEYNKNIKELTKIDSVKTFTFNIAGIDITYYFLLYDRGYISFDLQNSAFSNSVKIDLSEFLFVLDGIRLVSDLKIDNREKDHFYFLTEIGTFYIHKNFIEDIRKESETPFSKLLKIIVIPSEGNSKKNITATNIEDFGNTLYIGSKSGIYKIDKTTTSWYNFRNASGKALFPKEEVKKISNFGEDEFIVYMKRLSFYDNNYNQYDYLVVSTPRRLLFINNKNGRITNLNVFDGIPFVPAKKFSAGRKLNETIFKRQFSYSIKDIVYFDNKIWIATEFGLATMDIYNLK